MCKIDYNGINAERDKRQLQRSGLGQSGSGVSVCVDSVNPVTF